MRPYIRVTPVMVALENLGFPHGFSLNHFFPDEASAFAHADRIDKVFDAIAESIIEDAKRDKKEPDPLKDFIMMSSK